MKRMLVILSLATAPLIAGSLSGTVTVGGNPVEDAAISVIDANYFCAVGTAVSAANGSYNVNNLPDGEYYVLYSGPGLLTRYAGKDNARNLDGATKVNVSGNTNLNISGVAAASIQGRINLTGASIQDVNLYVLDVFSLLGFGLSGSDQAIFLAPRVILNNDGNYEIKELEAGCYIVGMNIDPGDLDLQNPFYFYGDTFSRSGATRVVVAEGETKNNVDITLNTNQLGTLDIDINSGQLNEPPDLTLVDTQNHLLSSRLNQNGSTSILVPPATYNLFVDFADTYRTLAPNMTYTVQAGQTTNATLTPQMGGSIVGTITYNPAEFIGQQGSIDLMNTQGGVVDSISFSATIGFENFIFSGLEDGQYVVRATPSGLFAAFGDPFRRTYFPDATARSSAQVLNISGGSTVNNVNITLMAGGGIGGQMSGNLFDLPENTILEITAFNVDNDEVYAGFGLVGQPYTISGLSAGNYKIGVNPDIGAGNGNFTSIFQSSFQLLCSNVRPSYYDGASTFDSAATVSVAQGATTNGIDLEVNAGGGIAGKIFGDSCDCQISFGIVGVYQGNNLVRTGLHYHGQFEINGLPNGSYTLRVITFTPEDLSSLFNPSNLGNDTVDTLFDIFETATYNQSVNVTSGQVTVIPDWCTNLQGSGTGNGGGGGGGGDNATTLMYPWVSNRADQFESILIANNLDDAAIQVTLTARRADGSEETVQRIISGNGFLEEFASSLFPTLGDGAGYAVTLTAPTDHIRGRWVTNNLTSTSGQSPSQGVAVRMPGSNDPDDERLGNEIIFGYLPVTNDFISAPVVVNLGDQATDVQLDFYDESGTMVGTSTQNLDPLEPFAAVANNLVNTNGDVYMTATSTNQPLTGVSFVFNNVGETAIGNVTSFDSDESDDGTKKLMYPWVSNNEGAFESIIVANNFGNGMASVTLTARRTNGDSETVQRQIPADGFLKEFASTLFPTLGSGPGYAVELTADTSKISGQWVTNNLQAESGASPSQGVAVDFTNTNQTSGRFGDEILFGYLPVTNTFVSAPVIVNLGDNTVDVVLTFYDADGNMLAIEDNIVQVDALSPLAFVVNNELAAMSPNVYMTASSNGAALTGVAFVFNEELEPAIGNASSTNSP